MAISQETLPGRAPAVAKASVSRGPARPPSRWRLRRSEWLSGYGFVLPIAILFVIFIGYPIISTVYLSLTSWSGFGTAKFTGFANYIRMFGDPVAQRALITTLIYAFVTTVLQTVIPLVIAVLVNSVWKGLSVVVRTILFIPGVVSFVVSGVLWKLIYDPNLGTLNTTLKQLGLGQLATQWLANPATELPAIMIVSLWGAVGMNMLIFFAGLQGVDPSYYEAAAMDGAKPLQQFRYITVPSLRVVTAIVVSLNLINGLKTFDIIFVMTGGGPNHASEVLGTYLYNMAFGSTSGSIPQLGYASAFSVVVMVLCGLAVLVQIGLAKRANR